MTLAIIAWFYTIALQVTGVFLYLFGAFLYPRHVARELRAKIIEIACLS